MYCLIPFERNIQNEQNRDGRCWMAWGRGRGGGEQRLHGHGCFLLGEDAVLEPDSSGNRTTLHVLRVPCGITSRGGMDRPTYLYDMAKWGEGKGWLPLSQGFIS